MSSSGAVRTSIAHGVGHIVLAAVATKNSLDLPMRQEVSTCLHALVADPEVRCIVLSSEGSAFCAGIALGEFSDALSGAASLDPARQALVLNDYVRGFQEWITAFQTCAKPIIAAIHGHCIGAGIDLITACDIRMCSKKTVFSVREARVGLAADVGTLQRLPKVVGCDSWVRDLALTGRDFGADEAMQRGLVQEVLDNPADLVKRASQLAQEIAANSPLAVMATKASLNYSRDHSVTEGLDHVRLMNQAFLQAPDLGLAMGAMKSKTPAAFPNLPTNSKL